MTTDREAMQMALEALDNALDHLPKPYSTDCANVASTLRTALSRKALDELADIDRELGLDYMQPDLARVGEVGAWGEREWQGLTDDDLSVCDEDGVLLARYWEAKLKERNT
jgi:hypothetical protein